jgi:hypothetical protein
LADFCAFRRAGNNLAWRAARAKRVDPALERAIQTKIKIIRLFLFDVMGTLHKLP